MEGEKQAPTERIQKRCRTHGFADDMIFEILTWLPAQSLLRFRCVSKAWNNLIRRDVHFVKLHHARSQTRPPATRLLFEIRMRHIFPNIDILVKIRFPHRAQLERFPVQLVHPHNYFDWSEIMICSNHCNGLVCLYNLEKFQGYLYNITTGEMKVLPLSLGYTEWSRPELYLGYDPATERYKLVHRIYYKNVDASRFEILTLGTNSWRRISDSPQSLPSVCIFLNGVLYWSDECGECFIDYFNLTEEKFGTLSLPQISQVSKIQTALCGKLILHPRCKYKKCNLVYDEVNKVFTKFDYNPDLEKEKVVFFEAEDTDKRKMYTKFILATSSLVSTPTSLVFSLPYSLENVSKFVENIVPLTFFEV